MEDAEVHWLCHGHAETNGTRGHMLKSSRVTCKAVLWFKLRDLDSYPFSLPCEFYYFHIPPANYQKGLYHPLRTTSSSFPPWSCCKVEMQIYNMVIIFMATDCGIIKTRLWWLHCRIQQKEKLGWMQKKLFFRHRLLWWQQGKTQKIIADVGKDSRTCHTNVSINHAQVADIVERSESNFWCFWKQMSSHWNFCGYLKF